MHAADEHDHCGHTFSLHYMVATALVHGSVRLSAFETSRLNDVARAGRRASPRRGTLRLTLPSRAGGLRVWK